MTRLLTILSIMALCLGIVSVAQAQEGVASHPPVNVQASVTDERVTLTCQVNVSDSQVTGYRIERYEGHRSGWNTLVSFLPAANQYPRNNPDVSEYRAAPPDSVALHHYPYWHDLPAMRR